jgi:CRP/FNR family transcriptional regulator, cyclic AMP receptor protein
MQRIDELLEHNPALGSLTPEHRMLIAGCARNCVFQPGETIMREGQRADEFFVIRSGSVSIDTFTPQRGAVTIETLDDGDLLGWSWLVPPYRVAFDARASTTVHAIVFDGACLRGKLDDDPALGYDLMKLFAAVIVERLQSTRLRLLDVYGNVPAGAE